MTIDEMDKLSFRELMGEFVGSLADDCGQDPFVSEDTMMILLELLARHDKLEIQAKLKKAKIIK